VDYEILLLDLVFEHRQSISRCCIVTTRAENIVIHSVCRTRLVDTAAAAEPSLDLAAWLALLAIVFLSDWSNKVLCRCVHDELFYCFDAEQKHSSNDAYTLQ
jgi:hypothetical protein